MCFHFQHKPVEAALGEKSRECQPSPMATELTGCKGGRSLPYQVQAPYGLQEQQRDLLHSAQTTYGFSIRGSTRMAAGTFSLSSCRVQGVGSRLGSTASASHFPSVSTANSWTETHWASPFVVFPSEQPGSQPEHRAAQPPPHRKV